MPGLLTRGPPGRLRAGLACVLCLWTSVAAIQGEAKKERVTAFPVTAGPRNEEAEKEEAGAFLGEAELPARAVDLSTLNLTELVNDMLNRALKDSKRFFSLLSITSHSSFAFHRLSVAIYNISNLKTVDQAKFPTRYCYCLSNRTNDLSDFTALLVDIIGNSTSYLTEIFKSTSILSVSQTNASDCIFICVMTGKAGRNLSDFWELAEKSPVINYTFTSSLAPAPATRGTAAASKLTPTSQQTPPRTSPPHTAQTEVPDPSERERAVSTDRLPELLVKATATATSGSVSPALPGYEWRHMQVNCSPRSRLQRVLVLDSPETRTATGRAAGTPWVTDGRLAWASTWPVPWALTTGEETPGGPPWEALSSAVTSPAEAEDTGIEGSLSEPPAGTHSSPSWTSLVSGTLTPSTQTSSPTKAPAPRYPHTDDRLWPSPTGEEPALVPGPHRVHVSRCPQQLLRDGPLTAGPLPGATHKLTPCLMELCRFFQQCLCASPRRDPRMETMRHCLESYSWFLKNAAHVCQKARRVAHSRTLKQRCLDNICRSV